MLYYNDGTTALVNGERDTYRETMAILRTTRDTIDKEIGSAFDGMRLDRKAIENVSSACDPEAVAVVLAITLRERRYDGRFGRDVKAWAEGIQIPACASGDNGCWYACRTHSAILDGFIRHFMK